ncbi:phosphopantetheine adenylyltransferase [Rubrivivax gelatinosus]|nr:phosphopantetheine adenylyltransferase [Rubrivivax gelatinosus]
MTQGHRHTTGHEHDYEPVRGLPEVLPVQEHMLWQGSPDWRALARRAFHVPALVLYFAAVLAARVAYVLSQGGSSVDALRALVVLLPLVVFAIALIVGIAWLTARGSVYTITDRRVVMRVGIVLTVTFNIPFKRIAAAGLRRHRDGTGDIPIALLGTDRIAFLHIWPHVRPWRFSKPEPMLRCIPDAESVARQLSEAWSRANETPAVPAAAADGHSAAGALAGHGAAA